MSVTRTVGAVPESGLDVKLFAFCFFDEVPAALCCEAQPARIEIMSATGIR